MHFYGPGFMWWWGLVLWLLIIGAVGVVAWLLIRSSREQSPAPRSYQAEELLRERFARGDLSEEEFNRSLEALRRSRTQ